MRSHFLTLFFAVLFIVTPTIKGNIFEWEAIETPSFVFYYKKGFEKQANSLITEFEKSRNYIESYTQHSLQKIPIIIEETGLTANGFASVLPVRIGIFTGFPNKGTVHYQNYARKLAIHELMHISQMTKASGHLKQRADFFGAMA